MKVSYDWLKEYLGETAPAAEKIEELLTFHAFEIEEVEQKGNQTVIDVDILPNRASDCLCHRGIAQEIASITNTPLAKDPLLQKPALETTDKIEVSVEDEQTCPRFTASLITGVEIKDSPDWLKERLQAIGQRPINNIVDATNYVMFAIGQPLHAYDADLFPQTDGKWQFGVRFAKAGETVSLIAEGGKDEDRVVELQGTEQLIVDQGTNTPIGLAGVKGGRFAGVHEGTKNIIIEAAHFDPVVTRKTARRLGIVIDASKRFENEPSQELPPYAQREIIELIKDIAGGNYEGSIDFYPTPKVNPTVTVNPVHVNALLGLKLTQDEMVKLLKRIGCKVEVSGSEILATGPWERTDLNIEEDFTEEIGRIYGYNHVESVVPETVPLAEVNTRHYYSEKIRSLLIELGFSEVITSSFAKKDKIQLRNALASDKSYVRSSLLKNINEVLDKNTHLTDLLGTTDTRVFEIGTVFIPDDGTVSEHVSLCLGIRIKQTGYSGKEDTLLQEVITALESGLKTKLSPTIQKGVAELNLTELIETLPVPTTYDIVAESKDIVYKPFSTYPFVTRDIAMWVPKDTEPAEIEKILKDKAGELCVRLTQFDKFTKDGRTSYAFRLVFQSYEKTLTDDEVNEVMGTVYAAVADKSWEVR